MNIQYQEISVHLFSSLSTSFCCSYRWTFSVLEAEDAYLDKNNKNKILNEYETV